MINHNLNKKPSVTIIDTNNSEFEGDVEHINNNQLILRFDFSMSGIVTCN